MYKTIKLNDLTDEYSNFKLCYVDYISEETYDENYNRISNPDYDIKTSRFSAYFTPIDLADQWGDDWNDAPYEYNAEIPYDDFGGQEYTILELQFGYPDTEVDEEGYIFTRDFEYYQPKDAARSLNSPWSVEDINLGAVPWIFAKSRIGKNAVVFNAGINPIEFKNKIEQLCQKQN